MDYVDGELENRNVGEYEHKVLCSVAFALVWPPDRFEIANTLIYLSLPEFLAELDEAEAD